jgi:hypothetical protein
MNDVDPFEPGIHTFTGVIKAWHGHSGELITESGLVIIFSTQNQPPIPEGTRVTLQLRKFRPRYALVGVSP